MSTDLPFVRVRESAILLRHGCASQIDLERLAKWAVEHIEQMDEIAASEGQRLTSSDYCRSLGLVRSDADGVLASSRMFADRLTTLEAFPNSSAAVIYQKEDYVWFCGITNGELAALAKLFKAGRDKQ